MLAVFSRSPDAKRLCVTASTRFHARSPNTSPSPVKNLVQIHPSRHLIQIHPSSRCTRWRLRGESQMGEDAGDGGWFFDGSDELQLPTTVRAVLDVDVEHAPPDH